MNYITCSNPTYPNHFSDILCFGHCKMCGFSPVWLATRYEITNEDETEAEDPRKEYLNAH